MEKKEVKEINWIRMGGAWNRPDGSISVVLNLKNDETLRGILFVNNRKRNEKYPDYLFMVHKDNLR